MMRNSAERAATTCDSRGSRKASAGPVQSAPAAERADSAAHRVLGVDVGPDAATTPPAAAEEAMGGHRAAACGAVRGS